MNTIGHDLDLSKGHVSQALLKKAGQKLQQEIKRTKRGYISEGEVIETSGCNLNCNKVYHTVCVGKSMSANYADQVGFLIYNHFSQCLFQVITKYVFKESHSSKLYIFIPFFIVNFNILFFRFFTLWSQNALNR